MFQDIKIAYFGLTIIVMMGLLIILNLTDLWGEMKELEMRIAITTLIVFTIIIVLIVPFLYFSTQG